MWEMSRKNKGARASDGRERESDREWTTAESDELTFHHSGREQLWRFKADMMTVAESSIHNCRRNSCVVKGTGQLMTVALGPGSYSGVVHTTFELYLE